MSIRQNIPLYVGLAIPVLMILFVAGAVYIPSFFTQPQYSFVYAVGGYPTYIEQSEDIFIEHQYSFQGNSLAENTRTLSDSRRTYRASQSPRFYIYDVSLEQNREISLSEAQDLSLDASRQSPDGFEVTYGSRDGGVFPFFFYGGRDYSKRFLQRDNVSHEIDVKLGLGSSDFQFVGWIIN